jgi:FkbH-like protein
LDLDHTLWGGVIGDDGLEGIDLGKTSTGEAFVAFQRYLKKLKERGVILAVCSKNNVDVAQKPFESHPEMILKMDDIALFVANWNDKAQNIRSIAKTLNIGLDSLVFFDDNPAERKIVRDFLPDVYTVEVPSDPSLYVQSLDQLGLFGVNQLSAEDLARTEHYRSNHHRQMALEGSSNLDEYLKSLQMICKITRVGGHNSERPLQLINKSNQFNLMTHRYSESEWGALIDSAGICVSSFRLLDRFGDNGEIAVVVTKVQNTTLEVLDWVMSCRVLSRGMERATLNCLRNLAAQQGCRVLRATYQKTDRNALVADLLPQLGFSLVLKNDADEVYELELPSSLPLSHFIEVNSLENHRLD